MLKHITVGALAPVLDLYNNVKGIKRRPFDADMNWNKGCLLWRQIGVAVVTITDRVTAI